jgi:hypothetical protein
MNRKARSVLPFTKCASNLYRELQAAILNHSRWMPSQLSAARLPKSIVARLPLVTFARTVRPGIHLRLQLRCRFKRRIALVYVPKKAVVTASTSSSEVRTIPLLGRVSPRKCHR